MSETDHYAFWRGALALVGDCGTLSREQIMQLGGVHENSPQPGFYRKPRKGEVAQPVAIWMDASGPVALLGGEMADASAVWTWCCKCPVSHETYTAVRDGAPWPDLAPSVGAAPTAARSNSGDVDPAEVLRDQIDAAKADLARFEKVTSDEQCAAAQSLRSRLLELSREADKIREKEKRPHFEAGKAVDERYQPLVKDAKAAADAVARAMGAWETEKARKAEAERRAREEAARKAEEERRRAEAEAAAKNLPPPAAPPVDEPAPEPEPVASTTVRGGYGRAATVKVVKVVAEITDQDALYRFMRERPEVIDLLRSLAQRAVNAGHDVPGVTIEEQRKVA
jgi:hypothetical protein